METKQAPPRHVPIVNEKGEHMIQPTGYVMENVSDTNFAIRHLQEIIGDLQKKLKESNERISNDSTIITNLKEHASNLEKDLQKEQIKYSDAAVELAQQKLINKNVKEAEQLILEEVHHRLIIEKEKAELQAQVEYWKKWVSEDNDVAQNAVASITDNNSAPLSVLTKHNKTAELQEMIESLHKQIETYKETIEYNHFELDELRVINIKARRRNDDVERKLSHYIAETERLSGIEIHLRAETNQLNLQMREMTSKLTEMSGNYTNTKANLDAKTSAFNSLTRDTEQLKNTCEMLNKQKKSLQQEFNQVNNSRQQLSEQVRVLEEVMVRKEKECVDLVTKINDTIHEYEGKIQEKAEKIESLTEKLNAELQKAQQLNMDADFFGEMERKWQRKERTYQAEIEQFKHLTAVKTDQVVELTKQIDDMNKSMFEPRMQRLKELEQQIRQKLEDFAITEEAMEMELLCLRCTQIFTNPTTLLPCSHTFCKKCLDESTEENYGIMFCMQCTAIANKADANGHQTRTTKIEGSFRNEQVQGIAEQFIKRKALMRSFMSWMGQLEREH